MSHTFNKVQTYFENDCLLSIGLTEHFGFEFKIGKGELETDKHRYLFAYVLEYLKEHPEETIKHNDTFEFHSWKIKFILNGTFMEIWELNLSQDDYVFGVETSLSLYVNQKANCDYFNTGALHPRFSQLIVVSEGADYMQELEAVRYASPVHMSGWWVTTDLYD